LRSGEAGCSTEECKSGMIRDGLQAGIGVPKAISHSPAAKAMQTWSWTKLGVVVTEKKTSI